MTPQQQMIKEALEQGRTLTPLDALEEFGCFKLATRIGELVRQHGLKIEKKMLMGDNGKHFMSYKLKKENA